LSPFYHQKKQAMYWITFFEILMLSLFLPSKEEVILFDVILRDEVVGELKAVKTTTATQTTYHSFTNIRTSFLEKLEVDYTTRVVYREGVMADAKVDISVNGKTFTDTHTKLVDGQYQFYKSGKLNKTLDLPIRLRLPRPTRRRAAVFSPSKKRTGTSTKKSIREEKKAFTNTKTRL
jgi:hypothetical protein